MRFELTGSTLAIFAWPPTPFGKFNNIESRGVACRPESSPGKWKVGWKVTTTYVGIDRLRTVAGVLGAFGALNCAELDVELRRKQQNKL